MNCMYLKKQNSLICFLLITSLVISLLLLGMCPDMIQADSSFSCVAEDEQNFPIHSATIHSVSSTSIDEQLYVRELLAEQEYISVIRDTARRINPRSFRNGGYFVSILLSLLLLISCILIFCSHEIIQQVISNVIIISYIHHQDGQKA